MAAQVACPPTGLQQQPHDAENVANLNVATQDMRKARRAICEELDYDLRLQGVLAACFEMLSQCLGYWEDDDWQDKDFDLLKEVLEVLETMQSDPSEDGPDAAEILAALFLLVVSGKFFKKWSIPLHESMALVRRFEEDDEEDSSLAGEPSAVQVEVLRILCPTLLAVLHRMSEIEQYFLFNDAAEHVAEMCESADVWDGSMSIRVPDEVQVLCLDLDDTIYLHEFIPEMFDVYEVVKGFMDPLVLRDMLITGVPHRGFLLALVDTMHTLGRHVYVVSFGKEEWVVPAVEAVFGDRIRGDRIYTRSGEPNCIEPADKSGWLAGIAARCGAKRSQVLLVDDSMPNHCGAMEQGFASLKVSPAEGLHFGVWGEELQLRSMMAAAAAQAQEESAAAGGSGGRAKVPPLVAPVPRELHPWGLPSPRRDSPRESPRDSGDKVLPRPPPSPSSTSPLSGASSSEDDACSGDAAAAAATCTGGEEQPCTSGAPSHAAAAAAAVGADSGAEALAAALQQHVSLHEYDAELVRLVNRLLVEVVAGGLPIPTCTAAAAAAAAGASEQGGAGSSNDDAQELLRRECAALRGAAAASGASPSATPSAAAAAAAGDQWDDASSGSSSEDDASCSSFSTCSSSSGSMHASAATAAAAALAASAAASAAGSSNNPDGFQPPSPTWGLVIDSGALQRLQDECRQAAAEAAEARQQHQHQHQHHHHNGQQQHHHTRGSSAGSAAGFESAGSSPSHSDASLTFEDIYIVPSPTHPDAVAAKAGGTKQGEGGADADADAASSGRGSPHDSARENTGGRRRMRPPRLRRSAKAAKAEADAAAAAAAPNKAAGAGAGADGSAHADGAEQQKVQVFGGIVRKLLRKRG